MGDTEVQTPQGKERRRDLGNGVTAMVTVGADADGNVLDEANPLPIRPIDSLTSGQIFALSSTYGKDMHLADGSFGGTELKINDGTDTTLWTATGLVGPASFTADSIAEARSGTKSIEWDGPATGDIIQIVDPTAPQDLSGHVALTFWVKILSGYSAGTTIVVSGWDGTTVGTPLSIESKIDQDLHDWQLVAFTLDELGLGGQSIDAIRLTFTKVGAPTLIYIDDAGFQETSGAEAFDVVAAPGTTFYVETLVAVIMDTLDTTAVGASMPEIDPKTVLGMPAMTSGILSELDLGSGLMPLFAPLRRVLDFQLNGADVTNPISGGGSASVKMVLKLPHSIRLRGGTSDVLRFTIRDDMTPLDELATYVLGGFEPTP